MKRFFLVSLMFGLSSSPTFAETAPGLVGTRATCPEREEHYLGYEQSYRTRILSNMVECSAPEAFTILFRIDKTGAAKDISIFDSSKSQNYDVAAIEAFLTSFPIQKPPEGKTLTYYGDLLPGRVDFKPTKIAKANLHKPCVIHAIPLDVSKRYPGTFKQEELQASTNELSYSGNLPKTPYATLAGTTHDHTQDAVIGKDLAEFFREWSSFFATHPNASREELLGHRDLLLSKFNSLKKVSA